MNYQGSCHCGNVKFEVESEIAGVISCNCSICSRKGSLLWFVPRDTLEGIDLGAVQVTPFDGRSL